VNNASKPSAGQNTNVEVSKKSVVILFAVGAIMLVAPLGTALSENSLCKTNATACNHSDDYRYLISSFPYIMLGGGLLIGYNMKRISDSINAQHIDDQEEEDDDSLASYS
jgi:hypothetical protein